MSVKDFEILRRQMLAEIAAGTFHVSDLIGKAALDMALKSVAQCAMVSLEMLQVLYNAKFEILRINEAMLELRKGL